jgi:hypothetical protein
MRGNPVPLILLAKILERLRKHRKATPFLGLAMFFALYQGTTSVVPRHSQN